MCTPKCLVCLSKPESAFWSLTLQLDTVTIEESSVKALSLRVNPWRLYTGPNIRIPSWKGTYGDTRFYSVHLAWRYLSEVCTLLLACWTTAHSMALQCFDGNGASDWCLSIGFVRFSYFLYNIDVVHATVAWMSPHASKLAAFVLSCLFMASITTN